MNKLFQHIKLRNQQRKEKSIADYLDRHYNVTAKDGVIYIMNGDSPASALPPQTTVEEILKQIQEMKDSFKLYTK